MERESRFTGTWKVCSSPDFNDHYLLGQVESYIRLRQIGERIDGEFCLGSRKGRLDGQLQGDNRICFDYKDEMVDQGGNVGWATLEGSQLMLVLVHYKGDEFTFVCERESSVGEDSGLIDRLQESS